MSTCNILYHKRKVGGNVSELSKQNSYMLRQAFMARKRRRVQSVDTVVDKIQEW